MVVCLCCHWRCCATVGGCASIWIRRTGGQASGRAAQLLAYLFGDAPQLRCRRLAHERVADAFVDPGAAVDMSEVDVLDWYFAGRLQWQHEYGQPNRLRPVIHEETRRPVRR